MSGTPMAGLHALSLSAQAWMARSIGDAKWQERAEKPMWKLSDQQPVTAAWWRERRKRTGRFEYLALGDSTAQGIGASMPGKSYVGQLVDLIEAELGETISVTNLAVSGAPSSLLVRDQLPRTLKPLTRDPELVTVAIGANDIAEWDPVVFHRNLTAIFDALPDRTIVGEVPSFHLPPREGMARQANEILHAIAEDRGLEIAPIYGATKSRNMRQFLSGLAEDGFHPNDQGYRVWAEAFWPIVRPRVATWAAENPAPVRAATQAPRNATETGAKQGAK